MVEPQDKCTRTFEEVLNSVDRNEATDPCSAQWILIWMYGAYIDEVPNDPQRQSIEVFYKTMPDLCLDKCYHKFVNQFSPKADNRRVLLSWIQMAENSCRIQNGLKPRPFNYKEVMKRWRYPDGKIYEKISAIDDKINNCNAELARIKQSITANASAGTLKIAKQKATEILRRRKAYEAQKQQLIAAQVNIDRSEHSAFQARTAVDVQNALKSTLKVMKKDLRKVNLNEIEKLQEKMEDMQDHAYEISEALGKQYENPDDVNEDDLEFELSMISQSTLEGSESADVMSGLEQTPSFVKGIHMRDLFIQILPGVKIPYTPINEPGNDFKTTLEE